MSNDNSITSPDSDHDDEGGTVSEGGSGALNSETAQGGADSVPDTPDVNDSGVDGAQDVSVADEQDGTT
ncbi:MULTISPECIES: hypothetical protein [unclassified Knoellia]|uniref:hypothetical protein n=1 Tax=Knoellia altitudinis TaxID=3404795 RepID=UPI003608ACC3